MYTCTVHVPVSSEYLLKLSDVIILIGLHQVGHGQDLRVVLVRLCLVSECTCTCIDSGAEWLRKTESCLELSIVEQSYHVWL